MTRHLLWIPIKFLLKAAFYFMAAGLAAHVVGVSLNLSYGHRVELGQGAGALVVLAWVLKRQGVWRWPDNWWTMKSK